MSDFIKNNMHKILPVALKLVKQFNEIKSEAGNEEFMQLIYENVEKIKIKSKMSEVISCSKSCSFCCHDEINLSKNEVEYLLSKIKENNVKPNRRLLKIQNKTEDFHKIKWAHKACSLLDSNGNCSVYEFRPMICRTHNSTIDPKFCNKEKYPNMSINEGRIIQLDAITTALFLMDNEDNFKSNKNIESQKLHKLLNK